jgi:hypothetical protein
MIVTNPKDKSSNIIGELYKKFELIASKVIVLRVFKDTTNMDDFIKAELPQPTLLTETWDGYFIGYAIKGKIKTKAQKLFYKHLSLRLKKTLQVKAKVRVENSSIFHLQYATESGRKITTSNVYEMKFLAGHCLSLTLREEKTLKLQNTTTREELAIFAGTYNKSEDALFDFIRHKAYDYKRINTINEIKTSLEDLTSYCKAIAELGYDIIGGKGISTAIAKAKNIAKWVYENYGVKKRKTKNDEELKMTRQEIARKNSEKRYNEAHRKIMSLITGDYKREYLKKDGSYNIAKIAKDSGYSRNTVYKHLATENLI